MAGELIISPVPYLTGANIYFQVFDAAGQIWDTGTSAFETYATASIGDYDIAATELGTASGIYQASMPSVPKGIVSAVARRRVGANPAETDPVVGVMAPRAWNGSAFVDVGDLATASALATADGKIDGIKAVTDKLDDLIEDASGYRFTEKALEEAPTGGSGGATAQEVWEYATRTLTALDEDSTTIDLDGAIQAATVGLDAKLDTIDGNVDAIKAVTDQLPDGGALTSLAAKTDLPANFADLSITATTGRVEIETNHDKTGYSLTSDYDAAKTAAQAGDEMALTSGTLSDIGTAAEAAAAAALADYDPPTKTQLDAAVAPLATSVELAAVDAKIDTVDGIADAILAAVGTDGVAISSATMQAIADALLDRANAIDGATPRAALRYIAAVLAGKVSGAGTGIETFYGLDGTTPRVEVTVDVDGNRSAVSYDP